VIPATIRLGVADHLPGEPATSFMARADRALYLAKENGRDRWEADLTFYGSSTTDTVTPIIGRGPSSNPMMCDA